MVVKLNKYGNFINHSKVNYVSDLDSDLEIIHDASVGDLCYAISTNITWKLTEDGWSFFQEGDCSDLIYAEDKSF